MNKNFFNRILHLLDHHPQKGKRLLGISSNALWELWQRITPLDLATQQKLAHRLGRKRQAGGGRKKKCDSSMPTISGTVVPQTTLDDARNITVH